MRKLNEKQIEEAGRMRLSGKSWREIGRAFSVREETVMKAVDPFEAERIRQRFRDWRARNPRTSSNSPRSTSLQPQSLAGRPERDEVEARRAEIPEDTRGLTAWMMGDPLPGRSALDQKRSA
jgi:hypothetical protein